MHPDGLRLDDTGLEIEKLVEQVRVIFQRRYSKQEAELLAAKYARRSKAFTAEQIQTQFRKVLGVDAFATSTVVDELVKVATKENVALITSIPSTYFEEIEKVAYDAVRTGISTEDLADQLFARYEITENRARFIAIDQANKMAGALTKATQENLGITGYVWRTTGDARVRDTHADLEGQTFDWSDPPVIDLKGRRGHPGYDFRCRCQAEPNFLTLVGEGGVPSGLGRVGLLYLLDTSCVCARLPLMNTASEQRPNATHMKWS
jgi:SPP1 gp7 family putative phage head morphogenesis protein